MNGDIGQGRAPIEKLRRIGIAYSIAPLAAVFMVWASTLALSAAYGQRISGSDAVRVLPYYFLVGAPIAYVIAGAVGFPILYWLRRRGSLRLAPLVTLGAAAGGASFWLLPFVLGQPGRPQAIPLAIGAVGGAAAALAFWAIAVREQTSRPVG